jgi:hypothetical protein
MPAGFSGLQSQKSIQDPVHGSISLKDWIVELIDTPQFQRLRRIKQLGFASLVYPGANHTRFEHSIGVLHVAERLIEKLESDVSERTKMELIASALLHDTGHAPFSHSSERVVRKYLRREHEDLMDCLRGTEIDDLLESQGLSLKRITYHVSGKSGFSVITGEIDADRMDYLVRDSHYTGVAYGVFDISRLIKMIYFDGGNLIIDGKGLRAAESLLISRFMMYPTVYYHHVCRIAKKMYEKALERSIEEKALELRNLIKMDDYDIICFLRQQDGFVRDIINRIDSRNLYKRAVYIGLDRIGVDIQHISEQRAEREISEISGVDEEEIIVDIPPLEDAKESSAMVNLDGRLMSLEESSPIVRALKDAERDAWKMGIYTTKENLEKVGRAAVSLFNIERRPLQKRLDEVLNI